MAKKASEIVKIAGTNYLKTLQRCGGYYECPRDPKGKRLGPLVGYAGKYRGEDDEMYQRVGDVYYNFAKTEEFPHVIDFLARTLSAKIQRKLGHDAEIDYVLGAPMGGIVIGSNLARVLDCRFVFAEKKVTKIATAERREESVLILKRHEIMPGTNVLITEDVCNNFSTTEELISLVEKAGAMVIGITCELNRSTEEMFYNLPVVALMHIPTEQYRQDDEEVTEDIQKGNVVWDPKKEWDRLQAAIEAAKEK